MDLFVEQLSSMCKDLGLIPKKTKIKYSKRKIMQKSNFLYIVNYYLIKVLYGRASEEFRQNKWGGGLELIH